MAVLVRSCCCGCHLKTGVLLRFVDCHQLAVQKKTPQNDAKNSSEHKQPKLGIRFIDFVWQN